MTSDRPERTLPVIAGGVLFIMVGVWALTKGDVLGIAFGSMFIACGVSPFAVLLLRR